MNAAVTTSLDEFTCSLRDGDVLLFDKLTSLNRLVQWGDNRPAGHCGVWRSGVVYEATNKKPGDAESEGGVLRTPFEELMNLAAEDDRGGRVALVRTVTAMRHPDTTDQHLQALWDYLDARVGSDEFAVMDAFLLTPFAIERAYRGNDALVDLMRGVIGTCRAYAKLSLAKQRGGRRMFCSKLVFSAFDAAALRIDIRDPLYDRYFMRGREPSPLSSQLDEYKQFFESEVLTEEPAMPDETHRKGATKGFLGFGKGGPTFADMVTPGDLWSSPSLDLVGALHRMP